MNLEKIHQENHEANEILKPRFATRTVLFDQDGKVAILNVKKHGYYKIPGGGVEQEEDLKNAASREVKEETGCDCNIINELGQVRTEIPIWEMLDISNGFVAVVLGEKSQPHYEEWERERGFELEWFDDINVAISTIEANVVVDSSMNAMQKRDLNFLKSARKLLVN